VLKGLALRLSNLSVKLALKPLEQGLGAGINGLFANLFGGGGPVTAGDKSLFAAMGDIKPFADGGVIASPSYFRLGQSGMGVAGEAGPEAILPLARGADGRLGVASAGTGAPPNITIHIATPDAQSFRRSESYVTGLVARAVARGQRGL
jgi:phage-related minor tail protein